MPLPGLPALEVFVAVARHRSFRKAATERGVSTSALSHVIRGLEQNLGVRLFNRTNRSIHITDAGEHLLGRIAPALGDITKAVAHLEAFRGRPAGSLRLNVPRNAAEIVIRPMTGRFLEAYPEIRLEVVTQDGLVDIVSEGFDAGIRAGQDLGLDMITVRTFIRSFIQHVLDFPVMRRAWFMILTEAASNPALRSAVDRPRATAVADLAGFIREGQRNGEIAADINPDLEAAIIHGSLRGLISL